MVNVVKNPASDHQWLVFFSLSTAWRRGSAGIEFRVYTLYGSLTQVKHDDYGDETEERFGLEGLTVSLTALRELVM